MNSARSPDEEMYPYEYGYYRKTNVHDDNIGRSQLYKYGDAESEMLYNYKTGEEEKVNDDVNYADPTMPYYVVPVLYVPKRVVNNEEMQPSQVQSVPKCKQEDVDRYERYRNYYYTRPSNSQNVSYYNTQYTESSSSFKEEYPQTYSYTYMPKTKPKIRNLKSQQDYETKMKTYESKSRPNTNNVYYYPNKKDVYYENVDNYYTYPTNRPTPIVENKPTRIAGSCNKAIETEIMKNPPKTIQEKHVIDHGTQTLESRLNSATISTQTEHQEKKSLIPSCRPKVQIENVYSDEEDKTLSENKPKETTRRCPSAKRPTISYQGVDQHPTRMPSPVRRSRKF